MNTKLTDTQIKELGYQIKKQDTIFMKDGKLDIDKLEKTGSSTGTVKYPTYNYEYYLDDGSYVVISGDREDGYSKTIRKKDELFERFYGYYTKGTIKNTGVYNIKGFSSGIRHYFDEKGEIEKYENYDAPYDFSWEDVVMFLKEKEIKEEQIINIYRGAVDGVYGWDIIYKPEELKNTDNAKVITLDAKTGKIIDNQIIDTARHLD